MSKGNGTTTLFVGGRTGNKKDGSGSYAIIEVVVLENGTGQTATLFTEPAVVRDALANFAPLEVVELEFSQRMTARGPRSELIGMRAATE